MKCLPPDPLRGAFLLLVLCATPLAQGQPEETGDVAPSSSPVTSSKSQVTSSKSRVTSSKSQVTLSESATRAIGWLRDSRLRGAPPVAHTVAAVAEQAAASLGELTAILIQRSVPALTEEQKPQILSVPQRDMLLEALGTLPPTALRKEIDRLLQADAGPNTRQVAIRMLGAYGTAEDVLELVDLTRSEPEAVPGALELQALRWSLIRIVLRDPRGMGELADLVHAQDRSLTAAAIEVIGEVGDPRGLEILLDVATRDDDLAALAIAQVRKVGRATNPGVNHEFGELLRGDLDHVEAARCRTAVIALGELAHFEAIPQLIDLLQNSEAMRDDCLWSLRRMTGLKFSDDALRWRRWHETETRWYERELQYLLRDLHGTNQARATSAVTAISSHRIYRHELAEELALALLNAPAARKRALCAALCAMNSKVGVEALVETLGSAAEGVRSAAHQALLSLTGLDLPAEQEPWEAALGAKPAAPKIATPR